MVVTMAALYRAIAPHVMEVVPRVLSDSSVDVLLQHAMDECDLPKGSVRLRASRVVRWAQELRSPAWLRDAATRHPSHRAARQLVTVARQWEVYEELLGSRAADRGTYSRRVVEAVRTSSCTSLRSPSGTAYSHCIILDTHGVTGVDAELLVELARQGWDIAIQFAPDVQPADAERISRTERDLQWFVAHGWHVGAHSEVSLPKAERYRVACSTRTDEVRRAVAVCKEAASSGVPLSSIALCVPGDQQYMDRLRSACMESGVPVDGPQTTSLAQTHAASLLYACCRVLTGRWLRDDVERVLREPLLRDLVPNGPALLMLARQERIVGGTGVEEWIARLEQRHADMELIAQREGDENDHAQRNVRRYAHALRTIRELRAILDVQVAGVMDVDRFTSILLKRLAASIDLERRCAEHEPTALGAIHDACSAYAALHRDHELPYCSFASHLHRWWMMVRSAEVTVSGALRSGVRILRPAELRGGSYDLVVAVGCVEGEFPRTLTQQLDEDVVPDVQLHLAWESLADLVFGVAPGGSSLFLYPTMIDGATVLPSTMLDVLLDVQQGCTRWKSMQSDVTCVVHPRQMRVDITQVPPMETSQTGDVRSLGSTHAQQLLQEDLSRPISPSRLDVAIQCPYRFFAQSILRLDDLDVDDVRLSPLERGTLLHDIAHRWYRKLRGDAPVDMTPSGLLSGAVNLSSASFEDQWALLLSTIDDVLAEQSHAHAFAPVERRALVGDASTPGLLQRWLALEREDQQASGFMPVLFELTIDIEITVATADGLEHVPITTRIDRIDVRQVDGELHVSVVDYKSSLSDSFTKTKVAQGQASQMPIYLAAVTAWFAQQGITVRPEAAVYRAFGTGLQSPANVDRRVVLADAGSVMASLGKKRATQEHASITDVLDKIFIKLHPGIKQIQSGVYPVRPLPSSCATCRVPHVCRKDHWGTVAVTTHEEEHHGDEG